jgi:GTP cyclohydrolase II
MSSSAAPADTPVKLVARAKLPTAFGVFESLGFFDIRTQREAVVLVKGEPFSAAKPPLVRIHSQCLTGDVFDSQRCDCGSQLKRAMELLAADEAGLLVYEFEEGRGIGILNKLRAYALQDEGADTIDANGILGLPIDARTYETSVAIIEWFGLRSVRLLTNNLDKVEALVRRHIEVERIPLVVDVVPLARHYLATKKMRLGHDL